MVSDSLEQRPFEDSTLIGDRVAFSAGLTKDETFRENLNIIYDKVFTNIGKAYSINTGTFQCQVVCIRYPGVYMFSVSLATQNEDRAFVRLFRNLEKQIALYEWDDNNFSGTGTSLILHLNKSDEVYVKAASESLLSADKGDIKNVFSGFLIYKD
ncbi:Complement C1q-like protein 2 [Bulinus truncatus]|nr:Complement C1q-like protein 2 [Bulinus truncatus]